MKENIMTRPFRAFNLLLILATVSQIAPLYADDAVPILLWGDSLKSNLETRAVSPFLKTSREEFDVFLRNKLENLRPVLVYLKDNLCVEDFTQYKEYLQQATSGHSLDYLPAVETPMNVLMDLTMYNQTYDDDVDSVSQRQLVIKSINDIGVIPETYKAIESSSPNLIAMLMGKSCSYRRSERVKRETPTNSNSTPFIITTKRVLLYSKSGLFIKTATDKEFVQLVLKSEPETRGEGTRTSPLILHMLFGGIDSSITKIILQFIFEVKSAGYYTLKKVNYRENDINDTYLSTSSDIVFPYSFSYHCSQVTSFRNGSVFLTITDLQVQIDAENFSDAYDCVGFTTIPIWTGIFVTAILAIIMIWALTMIIDIRTMDRFDDPKGKTITISAQE